MAELMGSLDPTDMGPQGHIIVVRAHIERVSLFTHQAGNRYQDNTVVLNIEIPVIIIKIAWLFLAFV
ncbi:hypothetical protein A6I77_00615 [Achromobacter xylosoxidans]|nr:hypothetical protein A6I77_00615 [Achromobacter xylosoxidans]